MKVISTVNEIKAWRKGQNQSIGFVPTMGALHAGHLKLVEECQKKCDLTVVSIFVNQTQFNDANDFETYPQDLQTDLEKLKSLDVDFAFVPTFAEIYPDNYRYKLSENDLSFDLCGQDRPGHFDGVLTVVMKLFNLVRPQLAFFGEKDFQQLSLIQGMVRAFFMDIEIVPIPTVRDEDGLALSSRNKKLTNQGLDKARFFAKTLKLPKSSNEIEDLLSQEGIEIDYIKEKESRRYGAVRIENVRLIDNVPI